MERNKGSSSGAGSIFAVPGLLEVEDGGFVSIRQAVDDADYRAKALSVARKRLSEIKEERKMLALVIRILENPNCPEAEAIRRS